MIAANRIRFNIIAANRIRFNIIAANRIRFNKLYYILYQKNIINSNMCFII